MARYDEGERQLALTVILCGPGQAGKSSALERIREQWGTAQPILPRAVRSEPVAVRSDPAATLTVEVVELDPLDRDRSAAVDAIRLADATLFVADSRRERLRDVLIAWASLLEQMREAGRAELPGVLLLNRCDDATRMAPADLEAVLGAGRFPSFETDARCGEDVARAFGELLRRAATRAHGELGLEASSIERIDLLAAIDGVCSRAVVRAAGPASETDAGALDSSDAGATDECGAPGEGGGCGEGGESREPRGSVDPVEPATPRSDPAPVRSPWLRFARRVLLSHGRLARERRQLDAQLRCVFEESRRPLRFLHSLLQHLDHESPRLSAALEEAVAGGRELLSHLEELLAERAPGRTRWSHRPLASSQGGTCDLAALARQAFAAVARENAGAAPRLITGPLPWCDGDADLLRMLLWAAFTACAKSSPPRRRAATIRLRAEDGSGTVRLRIGRVGGLARGAGAEEAALARRISRRLGIGFEFVERRAGARDLRFQFDAIAVRLPESERRAAVS